MCNIATAFNVAEQTALIEKWQGLGYRITNFEEGNLICVSVDGADVAVCFNKDNSFSGFYTNIYELVQIFNQAIMHPFIKGKKI